MKFALLTLFYGLIACQHIYGQDALTPNMNFSTARPVKYDTSASLMILPIASEKPQQQLPGLNKNTHAAKKKDQKKDDTKKTGIEQTYFGKKSSIQLLASFDGLGEGFDGPQGSATLRNPSDNSLAVGPDHIVQTVNSRMAIFTKKGKRFETTGKVLYGPVQTNNVFRGFGGPCERINNGDAVVRYDQLADRWLIVMPTFRRAISRQSDSTIFSSNPGKAERLYEPPLARTPDTAATRQGRPRSDTGTYCMCYAISTGPDPFGPYCSVASSPFSMLERSTTYACFSITSSPVLVEV